MPADKKTFRDVAPKIEQAGIPLTFSPRELSIGTGLGLTYIYEALRHGTLKGFRVGRRGWRIPADHARSWLESLVAGN